MDDGMVGMLGAAGYDGLTEESSLAAEVLPPDSILLDQEGISKGGGEYTFDVEQEYGGGQFSLNHDDTLEIYGLLNSREVEKSKRDLGLLLSRLERSQVEGITRRLFAALRNRSAEMVDLEDKLAAFLTPQHGVPKYQRPSKRAEMPAQQRVLEGTSSPPMAARTLVHHGRSRSEERIPPQFPAPSSQRRPRRDTGRPVSLTQREEVISQMTQRSERSHGGTLQPRRPTGGKRDELPEVFRRLTAPPCGVINEEEVSRARALVNSTHSGALSPPLTIGGIVSTETGPKASAYLEALLEAHECETGVPASSSRRPMFPLAEDIDPYAGRTPRVSEEKAKEIFDRLYKSGTEHRVRRRVYHELGLLVEQAKEAQTCTFEPRLPLAAYKGNQPPDLSVTDRLYEDSHNRARRKEEMAQAIQLPTFSPQTTVPPAALGLHLGRRPASPSGDHESGMVDENGMALQNVDPNYEPPFERLYRENTKRLERKRNREEGQAEWRKHTFAPDISRSQATGPQVTRQSSLMSGTNRDFLEDNPDSLVATVEDEIDSPSLAAHAVDVMTADRPEGDHGESSEALLLMFPDAQMPPADNFEEELINGLFLLGGVDCVTEITLRLVDNDGVVVAELRGPRERLAILRELQLFDLMVLGFQVGEVRWTSSRAPLAQQEGHATEEDNQEVSVESIKDNTEASVAAPSEAYLMESRDVSVTMAAPGSVHPSEARLEDRQIAASFGRPVSINSEAQRSFTSAVSTPSVSSAPFVKPSGPVVRQVPVARTPTSQYEQQLSREASASTFASARRQYSGQLQQGQPAEQATVLTSARGLGASSVRYPPELAQMPSAFGVYGYGGTAYSPRAPAPGVQRMASSPKPTLGSSVSTPLVGTGQAYATPYSSVPYSGQAFAGQPYGNVAQLYSSSQRAAPMVLRAGY